jgi:hypothetical protein
LSDNHCTLMRFEIISSGNNLLLFGSKNENNRRQDWTKITIQL